MKKRTEKYKSGYNIVSIYNKLNQPFITEDSDGKRTYRLYNDEGLVDYELETFGTRQKHYRLYGTNKKPMFTSRDYLVQTMVYYPKRKTLRGIE